MINRLEIVVWFSCGAASAVAAYETLRLYRDTCNIRIVNNPVIEEHSDNYRFLRDCEKWFDHPIEFAVNQKYEHCSARQLWQTRSYMSGIKGAPCTHELKKKRANNGKRLTDAISWF